MNFSFFNHSKLTIQYHIKHHLEIKHTSKDVLSELHSIFQYIIQTYGHELNCTETNLDVLLKHSKNVSLHVLTKNHTSNVYEIALIMKIPEIHSRMDLTWNTNQNWNVSITKTFLTESTKRNMQKDVETRLTDILQTPIRLKHLSTSMEINRPTSQDIQLTWKKTSTDVYTVAINTY